MDIRIEIIRIGGVWTVTTSGPDLQRHGSYEAALAAATDLARKHHERTGGSVSVHAWHGATEAVVFDIGTPQQAAS